LSSDLQAEGQRFPVSGLKQAVGQLQVHTWGLSAPCSALFQHSFAPSLAAPCRWCKCTSCFWGASRHPAGGAGPSPGITLLPSA
jgi:hypothetical protein